MKNLVLLLFFFFPIALLAVRPANEVLLEAEPKSAKEINVWHTTNPNVVKKEKKRTTKEAIKTLKKEWKEYKKTIQQSANQLTKKQRTRLIFASIGISILGIVLSFFLLVLFDFGGSPTIAWFTFIGGIIGTILIIRSMWRKAKRKAQNQKSAEGSGV